MTRTLTVSARRLAWRILAFLHIAGLFRPFNYLVNRFEKADGAPAIRRRRFRNVQILVYHRVTHQTDPYLPAIELSVFERQMECLARHFRVLDLLAAVEAMANHDVPENAVVITFDDGYRDNFDLAYPILKGLSLEATIFLTTGVIGTDRVLWHDRVFRAFHETRMMELREFEDGRGSMAIRSQAEKSAARGRVLEHFKSLDPTQREAHIDALERRLDVADPAPTPRIMLSWEEVRAMHQGGISFGGHTVTHPVLSRIPAHQAEWEVGEPKREIEHRVKTKVRAFAYPNGRAGDFNATTKELVKRAGYVCAVTTVCGTNSPGDWDPLALRRDGPGSDSRGLFLARMNLHKLLS